MEDGLATVLFITALVLGVFTVLLVLGKKYHTENQHKHNNYDLCV